MKQYRILNYAVYILRFPNGKLYVGQSKNLPDRWYQYHLMGMEYAGLDYFEKYIYCDNLTLKESRLIEHDLINLLNCIEPYGYNNKRHNNKGGIKYCDRDSMADFLNKAIKIKQCVNGRMYI